MEEQNAFGQLGPTYPKKKQKQVVCLRHTPTPKSLRKDPPENVSAASSTGAKPSDDGDSTSTFAPSVANHVPYINVTPRGAANYLSPMTERWAVDNASVGNSAITTVTMRENAEDLELLVKADDESVGDSGSSDAEGDGDLSALCLMRVLNKHPLKGGITIIQTLRRTYWTQSSIT